MTMKFFIKTSSIAAGFTLIETLVAITILMISIAGPLTIASQGLTAAVGSRDQVIASYLSQDLMEYLMNIRDGALVYNQDTGWATYLIGQYSGCSTATPCGIETTPQASRGTLISGCSTIANCRLYLDNTYNYYTYTSNSQTVATQFYRTFSITPLAINGAATDGALLTVTTTWRNGTISNNVTLKSVLFNTLR